MKKIFVFIFIFTMLFTINVFADSIPQKVLQKIEDENLNNYVVVFKENAFYIGYVDNINYKPYYYDIYEQDIVFKDATGNILDCYVFYSDDNGLTWKREFYNNSVLRAYYLPFNSTVSHDTILTSKYNVILQSDNSVFFSAPAEPFLPAKETTSLVPTVGKQSVPILVVSVVILVLMMTATLIPRVLYRLL